MSLPLVSATTWGFSTLPDEIIVQILRYRLIVHARITSRTHSSHCARLLLPLARVNKELKSLATEVYYTKNTFVIRNQTLAAYTTLLGFPKPAFGVWIRHVEIHLNAVEEIGFPYWYDDKPLKPGETKQIANFLEQGDGNGIVVGYAPTAEEMAREGRWQLPHFPGLKTLKLSLDFRHYERNFQYGYIQEGLQEAFYARMGKRDRAVLRAKSIEVAFKGCEEMRTPEKRDGPQYVATIVADLERICNGDKEDARIGRAPRGLRILK